MGKTKVGALCGIGPKLQRELGALGIVTCGDLSRYPERLLQQRFGKAGERLVRMAKGEDDGYLHRIGATGEPTKSVGHSMTFSKNLYDKHEIERKLRQLAIMVGKRARKYHLAGKNLAVTVRFADFGQKSKQVSFSSPINRDDEIFDLAAKLLAEISTDKPVRLLGIQLSTLSSGDRQPSLFSEENRLNALQQASDSIIDRFGTGAIGPAVLVDTPKQDVVIPPSWRPDGVRNPTSDR
jgi:DNA polymerase-4